MRFHKAFSARPCGRSRRGRILLLGFACALGLLVPHARGQSTEPHWCRQAIYDLDFFYLDNDNWWPVCLEAYGDGGGFLEFPDYAPGVPLWNGVTGAPPYYPHYIGEAQPGLRDPSQFLGFRAAPPSGGTLNCTKSTYVLTGSGSDREGHILEDPETYTVQSDITILNPYVNPPAAIPNQAGTMLECKVIGATQPLVPPAGPDGPIPPPETFPQGVMLYRVPSGSANCDEDFTSELWNYASCQYDAAARTCKNPAGDRCGIVHEVGSTTPYMGPCVVRFSTSLPPVDLFVPEELPGDDAESYLAEWQEEDLSYDSGAQVLDLSSFADLRGARLIGQFKITGASGKNLSGANFEQAIISKSDLSGATLNDARFRSAQALEVNFRGAQLTGAQFQGALIAGADFRGANLTNADFSWAKMSDSQFQRNSGTPDTVLNGAVFLYADVRGSDFMSLNLGTARLAGGDFTLSNFRDTDLDNVPSVAAADFNYCRMCGVSLPNLTAGQLRMGNWGGAQFNDTGWTSAFGYGSVSQAYGGIGALSFDTSACPAQYLPVTETEAQKTKLKRFFELYQNNLCLGKESLLTSAQWGEVSPASGSPPIFMKIREAGFWFWSPNAAYALLTPTGAFLVKTQEVDACVRGYGGEPIMSYEVALARYRDKNCPQTRNCGSGLGCGALLPTSGPPSPVQQGRISVSLQSLPLAASPAAVTEDYEAQAKAWNLLDTALTTGLYFVPGGSTAEAILRGAPASEIAINGVIDTATILSFGAGKLAKINGVLRAATLTRQQAATLSTAAVRLKQVSVGADMVGISGRAFQTVDAIFEGKGWKAVGPGVDLFFRALHLRTSLAQLKALRKVQKLRIQVAKAQVLSTTGARLPGAGLPGGIEVPEFCACADAEVAAARRFWSSLTTAQRATLSAVLDNGARLNSVGGVRGLLGNLSDTGRQRLMRVVFGGTPQEAQLLELLSNDEFKHILAGTVNNRIYNFLPQEAADDLRRALLASAQADAIEILKTARSLPDSEAAVAIFRTELQRIATLRVSPAFPEDVLRAGTSSLGSPIRESVASRVRENTIRIDLTDGTADVWYRLEHIGVEDWNRYRTLIPPQGLRMRGRLRVSQTRDVFYEQTLLRQNQLPSELQTQLNALYYQTTRAGGAPAEAGSVVIFVRNPSAPGGQTIHVGPIVTGDARVIPLNKIATSLEGKLDDILQSASANDVERVIFLHTHPNVQNLLPYSRMLSHADRQVAIGLTKQLKIRGINRDFEIVAAPTNPARPEDNGLLAHYTPGICHP